MAMRCAATAAPTQALFLLAIVSLLLTPGASHGVSIQITGGATLRHF
jgi:hypothetical protein